MVDQEECLPLINDEDIINNCGPIEIPPPPALIQTLDASGPRLMITHIVAENFKSYGGRRVMGPFHKNFTCVIGKIYFLSLILQVPMEAVKVMLLMPCYLYLVIEHRRYVPRNLVSLFIIVN